MKPTIPIQTKPSECFANSSARFMTVHWDTQDRRPVPCKNVPLFAYNDSNNENGEQPGDVITGSSNLSYQGLQGRTEINVRFTDKANIRKENKSLMSFGQMLFLLHENIVDRWKRRSKVKYGFDRLFQPYKLYLRVLNEYFGHSGPRLMRTPSTLPMVSSLT